MKNVLLTGKPGVGKSTLIKRAIEILGREVGGYYTEEIKEGEHREGFKIKTFSGQEDILAHVDHRSDFRTERYGVNLRAFETTAAQAILSAIDQAELIVLDELGRMELPARRFRDAVMKALDSPKPVLGVIKSQHNEFLDGIRERRDVRIVEVTIENRDVVLPEIVEMLC